VADTAIFLRLKQTTTTTLGAVSKREWNTPVREPWNPMIKECLLAVDRHMHFYLASGDSRHLNQAAALRGYVTALKDWIKEEEG
jgi:hypothetical protein